MILTKKENDSYKKFVLNEDYIDLKNIEYYLASIKKPDLIHLNDYLDMMFAYFNNRLSLFNYCDRENLKNINSLKNKFVNIVKEVEIESFFKIDDKLFEFPFTSKFANDIPMLPNYLTIANKFTVPNKDWADKFKTFNKNSAFMKKLRGSLIMTNDASTDVFNKKLNEFYIEKIDGSMKNMIDYLDNTFLKINGDSIVLKSYIESVCSNIKRFKSGLLDYLALNESEEQTKRIKYTITIVSSTFEIYKELVDNLITIYMTKLNNYTICLSKNKKNIIHDEVLDEHTMKLFNSNNLLYRISETTKSDLDKYVSVLLKDINDEIKKAKNIIYQSSNLSLLNVNEYIKPKFKYISQYTYTDNRELVSIFRNNIYKIENYVDELKEKLNNFKQVIDLNKVYNGTETIDEFIKTKINVNNMNLEKKNFYISNSPIDYCKTVANNVMELEQIRNNLVFRNYEF